MTDTLTETEVPSTDEVLVGMLTENTGRHMLDSGGAYGRNWERNGGLTVEAAKARPEVVPVIWNDTVEYVNLDVFHFLSQRLEYAPVQDEVFRAFAMTPDYRDESWMVCLYDFLDLIGAEDRYTVNTYNNEDFLTQVLQYEVFDFDGETYCALQIHGGCDVRGGYTAPRIFTMYGERYALMDNADLEVWMEEPERGHANQPQLDGSSGVRAGRRVWITLCGNSPERYTEDDGCDEIDFLFGETKVAATDNPTTFLITEGPAAGWSVSFGAPIVS